MSRNSFRPFLIAALLSLLAGLLLALPDLLWTEAGAIWGGFFTEQNTLHYFCEPSQVDAFVRQPADTYSNLGFLFAGVVILVMGLRDGQAERKSLLQRHRVWSFLYAGALIFNFLGSAFFHASLTRFAEWVDLAAVFATAWIPVAFNLHALRSHTFGRQAGPLPWVILYLVLFLLSCISIFNVKAWYTFPAALLAIGISSLWIYRRLRSRASLRWLAASSLMTLFAVMWFAFDIRRVGCDPDSIFQPHAVWHLCDAAAAGLFYGFMRSLGRKKSLIFSPESSRE